MRTAYLARPDVPAQPRHVSRHLTDARVVAYQRFQLSVMPHSEAQAARVGRTAYQRWRQATSARQTYLLAR
jgi:hypothetical protein